MDRRLLPRASGCIACAAPSSTRRLRNAVTRETTGKPCAGNPHARFERGSCRETQDLPMKTTILDVARSLSDQDLLDSLPVLAGNERHSSVELIAHLAALQERPSLYEGLGFGSLFEYCTSRLRLSEDATCTRTAVAGACRRFPVILDLLATGATNLTNIRRLAGKLTAENHEAILARAVHRTREEIEILVRELDPLPDLRSSVRKVAAPVAAGSPPPAPAHSPSQGAISLPPAEGAAPVAVRASRSSTGRPALGAAAIPRQVHHRRGNAPEAPARPDPAAPRDPRRRPRRDLRSRARGAPGEGREDEAGGNGEAAPGTVYPSRNG